MITPLIVAIPFAAAALLTIVGKFVKSQIADVIGIGSAFASTVLAALLFSRAAHRTVVYWFGGWRPKEGQFPLGISFTVDRIGSGLALFACGLVTCALLYSWRYIDDEHHLFEAIVLLFGAGMAGFALSGDLFNMFVFFELMSVCAYALTAYKVEQGPSLQAAFNFGVVNSLGSFLAVIGLGLVYGRTGSLNLAEIGDKLGERHDGLVVVAFSLLVCGFAVKAAIVPFHFWLADAYAAAPAPVCLLFAAVMSDLGIYAIARIHWTVFGEALHAYAHEIRVVLLVLGATTALVGACMAVLQRHLKRLLAFATISELGCELMGVGLLSHDGTGGAAVTVLAHGLAKGALFLACGVVLLALDDVDELRLHGKGRRLPWVGAAWLVAVVALASPPFLGIWSGHALIEDAAYKLHDDWVAPILAISTILATGAIARAGGRVFLGLGPADDPLLSDNPPETPASRDDPSLGLMTAITLALALGGLAVGALTGVATTLEDAAHGFVNHKAYVDAVLHHVPHTPEENSAWVTTTSSVVWGVVTLLGTFASAAFGLYRARLPEWTTAGLTALARPFRAVHSGHVGDYVAWLICGAAAVGGVFALTIR